MGWVLKSWRLDALASMASAEARAAARGIVEAARRDARRAQRRAARETADACARLDALERFGVETRRQVADERRRLRGTGPAGRPRRFAATSPAGVSPAARAAHASLRETPLLELFRATASR